MQHMGRLRNWSKNFKLKEKGKLEMRKQKGFSLIEPKAWPD
jgi:hypothetical protein